MNDTQRARAGWGFWVICLLGLLWNAGGAANYLMQTDPAHVSNLPATHQALIVDRPVWATAGFAIGVFGGVFGCVLLMWRRRVALPVLLVSVIGIVLTVVHTLNVALGGVAFSAVEWVLIGVLPLLVALGLAAYARGVLRRT